MNNKAALWGKGGVALVLCSVLMVACATGGGARRPGRAARAYGYVDVQCEAETYRLVLAQGSGRNVTLESRQNPAELPVGQYLLLAAEFESKDAEGATWRAINKLGKAGMIVTVAEGETAQLACGPPLTAQVMAGNKSGGIISFGMAIEGQGGLEYSAAGITRGGHTLPSPTIEIRDAVGELVTQGAFKYG